MLRHSIQPRRHGLLSVPRRLHTQHEAERGLFYCFGCGAGGDVITFTARLFNMSPYEAARKLASDFNIRVDIPLPEQNNLRTFRMVQYRCQKALDSYLNLFIRWKREYEPKAPDEEWDEHYLEACQMMDQGRIIFDVEGDARKKLTLPDLLVLFREAAGRNLDNDRMMLS